MLLRLFQILAAFIPGAMNGWLTYYLFSSKLGPSILVLVLEVLVCLENPYLRSTTSVFSISDWLHSGPVLEQIPRGLVLTTVPGRCRFYILIALAVHNTYPSTI